MSLRSNVHLSDVGLYSIKKDKLIKAVESKVGLKWNMSEDWMSDRRNGRHISRRLRAMSSSIGPKGSDIALRRSGVADINMSIGQYIIREDDMPKVRVKHRMNQ